MREGNSPSFRDCFSTFCLRSEQNVERMPGRFFFHDALKHFVERGRCGEPPAERVADNTRSEWKTVFTQAFPNDAVVGARERLLPLYFL